jgi:hypothetical protein
MAFVINQLVDNEGAPNAAMLFKDAGFRGTFGMATSTMICFGLTTQTISPVSTTVLLLTGTMLGTSSWICWKDMWLMLKHKQQQPTSIIIYFNLF